MSEEKSSNSLVALPKDFFSQVKSYFENKERVEKEDKWEFDDAKRRFEWIMEMRERKIVMSALYYARGGGIVPENMTEEEKAFFDKVVLDLQEFQKTKGSLFSEKGIEILQDVPEFVAPDMKTYGPLKKGDVASLPEEVIRLFLKKGVAKRKE